MGDYDTFHARCPNCGSSIEEQTKAFYPQYRQICVGDVVDDCNVTPDHTLSIELSDCYECKGTLFANFRNKRFIGFTMEPAYLVNYSDKNRRQEIKDSLPAIARSFET